MWGKVEMGLISGLPLNEWLLLAAMGLIIVILIIVIVDVLQKMNFYT